MEIQINIIKRNAYKSGSDRFEVVAGGKVIAGGLHHKRPFRSEWVVTTSDEMPRFTSKKELIESFE